MSALQFAGKADAYLEWASATGYRYLRRTRERVPRSPAQSAGTEGKLDLLVKWKRGTDPVRSIESLPASFEAHVADAYEKRRICAVSLDTADVPDLLRRLGDRIEALEFASPLVTTVRETRIEPIYEDGPERGVVEGNVLMGVIDDGCPFANERFMTESDKAEGDTPERETRVAWLWDQNLSSTLVDADVEADGPTSAANFGYGHQWARHELMGALEACGGNDIGAYRLLGLESLARNAVHGAHVMDLLAGGARKWPIVFVQYPRDGVEDPTGRWLARYTLDALHFILQCAGEQTTQVIVNMSWGPPTGPHDGTSLLEEAIDELIDHQPEYRTLSVVLPVGNTFRARAHGVVDAKTGCTDLQWIVPPAGEAPAFVEIWWPRGTASDAIALTVAAPDGTAQTVGGAAGAGDAAGFHEHSSGRWSITLIDARKNGAMALLAVVPTDPRDPSPVRGPHGTWKISIRGQPAASGDIHLYVARSDHSMGAHRRASPSYLDDGPCSDARFVAPARRDDEAPGSVVRRSGTLNGAGTGRKVLLAAGHVGRVDSPNLPPGDGPKPAPYSSSGPSRRGGREPSSSYMTDQSIAIQGVRASGVRSGTKVRLVGTSMAAPQLGRAQASPPNAVASFTTPKEKVPRLGVTCEPTDPDFRPRG